MTSFAPPCGPIVGWVDGPVVRATGVPYARAQRFSVPVAVEDWSAPLHATQPAPACPQPSVPLLEAVVGNPTGGLPQQEQCLNLSVTLPLDRREGERLPVMVWIHGGSYVSGAGDAALYDASALVSEQRVVFVAVTYRLGVLGYLGGEGRPANLGLLDQLAALAWVQRNIAAFGGDPGCVTAFGQSAGADAVLHLMATPKATQLFKRAIIQSAPFGVMSGRQPMAAALASAGASIGAEIPIGELVAAQATVAAAARPFGLRGAMAFGTHYGAAPLPSEATVATAWANVAPRIDVLVGNTTQEARLFFTGAALRQASGALEPVVRPLASLACWWLTKKVYSAGATAFAQRHARAGGKAWQYTFEWGAPGNAYGAAHAIDIPFLFGNPAVWTQAVMMRGASAGEILAKGKAMRELWARFARGEGLPERGEIPGLLSFVRAERL